jgi:hypothetical protein
MTQGIVAGRVVTAYSQGQCDTTAKWIAVNDLVTVTDSHGSVTAWVIGVQRDHGYTMLVLDTPYQPTYWSMRDRDDVVREGHDYTEFANAWAAAYPAPEVVFVH